jgi:hypothetical protein
MLDKIIFRPTCSLAIRTSRRRPSTFNRKGEAKPDMSEPGTKLMADDQSLLEVKAYHLDGVQA